MTRQDVTDELIDRRLEFLFQRWQRADMADSGWLDPGDMRIYMRRLMETMFAYFEAVNRYDRPAPSEREQKRQENAAWN